MTDRDTLDAMSAEEVASRLEAPPAERAAFVRGAAEAGVAEAQAVYAQMLLDGHGVPADPVAALHWFGEAAHQGHLLAINMVGRCCELGWGTPVNTTRAAAWYRVAAEGGLHWGMYNFATRLALGDGVPEDKPAALDWFRRAADLGNAKAWNFVGSFHEDGWAGPRDMAKAAACYRRAAEGDDFRGAFNYARMLIDAGLIDDALRWLARSGALATPRFRVQAAGWCRAHPRPDLRAAAASFEVEPA